MRKRSLLLTVTALAIIIIGGAALLKYTDLSLPWHSTSSKAPAQGQINYEPATPQEKKDSESKKDTAPQPSTPAPSHSDSKKTVNVEISTWSQKDGSVNINGFAMGVVEETGTCTLKLSNGTQTISQSRSAEPNSSTMTCGVISVPVSELHTGTWQAVLSYSSNTATGASSPLSIEVQ